MTRYRDREPESVSADSVADFLVHHGHDRSARFVRALGIKAARASEIQRQMDDEIRALKRRLAAYEPTPAPALDCVSYRPDARSSD